MKLDVVSPGCCLPKIQATLQSFICFLPVPIVTTLIEFRPTVSVTVFKDIKFDNEY